MASIVMSEDLRRSRVLTILECLADPDRDIVPIVSEGITFWQQVRANALFDMWDTKEMDVFYKGFDHFTRVGCLSADEEKALDGAGCLAIWDNTKTFYRAGFEFGQQVASVDLATQNAVAQAIAIQEDIGDDWGAVLHAVQTRDIWEEAALTVAVAKCGQGSLLNDEWSHLLEELMKSPSVSFKDTDKVDVLLNNAICTRQRENNPLASEPRFVSCSG